MNVFRSVCFSTKSNQFVRLYIRTLSTREKILFSDVTNAQEGKRNKAFPYFKGSIALTVGISLGVLYYKYFITNKPRNLGNKHVSIPSLKKLNFSSGDATLVSPRTVFNFLADVADTTAPSVVYIEITAKHPITKKRIALSNGSGFIVKSDGLILTNAHVVANFGHVIVKLYDGREFEGVIETQDTGTDLATIRIEATELPVLPLGDSSKLRPGEFVIAMGNPLTLSHTITAGVVSAANRFGNEIGLQRKFDYIQTDAAVNIGNSGGPLVNLDGEAIGVNSMKVTEGISFAIPSDRALEFLAGIEEKKKTEPGVFRKPDTKEKEQKFLGIIMVSLTPNLIEDLKDRNSEFPSVEHGVLVWRVISGSPAYEAGIKPGDVIININDKEINASADIYDMVESDAVLNIKIVRRRKTLEKVVTILETVSH